MIKENAQSTGASRGTSDGRHTHSTKLMTRDVCGCSLMLPCGSVSNTARYSFSTSLNTHMDTSRRLQVLGQRRICQLTDNRTESRSLPAIGIDDLRVKVRTTPLKDDAISLIERQSMLVFGTRHQ